ncbi:HalOD1 output domain-containing protein [Natrarchaeobius chitinivorans]|uniref:Halobacterial output domain-containing protein n=1 Tax=Natrarchaeobius chitinivorans TaxID=1679083 RepID=A0A3N6M3B9_NATCH|nr:HalOD1 output domain-containing protein [Natrarchaeobius chitinivorans]RQG97963.1 hypothetical protein EA473_01865 [Natrarchaeobius chitinivorans]
MCQEERKTRSEYPVSLAVIEAVAERDGVDPVSLPPLYESIPPDALDSLFDDRSTDSERALAVEFAYHGYTVTITDDEGVRIVEADRKID